MNDMIEVRFAEQNELLNRRFDEIERLLNTPQGQRPDFPNK